MKTENRLMYLARSRQGSFRRLVDKTKSMISQYIEMVNNPYIAFSGGKDSLANLILFQQMGLTETPVLTIGEDIEYDFKEAYCHQAVHHLGFNKYHYVRRDVSIRQALLEGLGHKNCKIFYESFFRAIGDFITQGGFDGTVLGLRSDEAWGREKLVKSRGQIYDRRDKSGGGGVQKICLPMAYWRGIDVFALIISTDTPYIERYDKDEFRPPHELRFAMPHAPELYRFGYVSELRRQYPETYNDLAALSPQISRYT